MENNLNKFKIPEIVLIYILSPCCIPIFTLITFALGYGNYRYYNEWGTSILLIMSFSSILGYLISYLRHRNIYPLLIAIISGLTIFLSYHLENNRTSLFLLYTGMVGFLMAMIMNFYKSKMHKTRNVYQ